MTFFYHLFFVILVQIFRLKLVDNRKGVVVRKEETVVKHVVIRPRLSSITDADDDSDTQNKEEDKDEILERVSERDL